MGRSNLPPPRTGLIGRARELEEIGHALEEESRLITLTGPPGIGKSALARHVAHAQQSALEGGAWRIVAAEARNEDDLALAITEALGVEGRSFEAALEWLRRSGAALLVLDDVDAVVSDAAAIVRRLLDETTTARVLATSRVPLALYGERRVRVEPLDAEAATTLFLQRAAEAGASVPPEDRPAARALVEVLDGIPLAIELAAGRAPLLSAPELLETATRDLGDLRATARDADPRHATLEAALDGSWRALMAPERRALAAAATFRGGFTLAAAGAVLGADALDRLAALERRSLIEVDRRAEPTRFRLLAPVAAMLRRTADPDERAVDEDRHARFFAEWGASAAAACAREASALEPLLRERDNLIAAAERFAESRPELAARTLAGLGPLVAARGVPARVLGLIERVAHRAEAARRPTEAADLAMIRSRAHVFAAEPEAALDWAERGLALARAAGAPALEARLFVRRSQALISLKRAGQAEADARAALRLRDLPDDVRAEAQLALGAILYGRGAFSEACTALSDAVVALRAAGQRVLEARASVLLGDALLDVGRLLDADATYLDALVARRAIGDRYTEGRAATMRGVIALEQGRFDDAEAHIRAGLSASRELADVQAEVASLGNLVILALLRRRPEDAAGAALALEALGPERFPRAASALRACLGALAAAQGRIRDAEVAFARARQLGGGDHPELAVWEAFLSVARADGEPDRANVHLADAVARLERARTESSAGHGLRLAIAALSRALDELPARVDRDAGGAALELAADNRWFRPPGAGVVRIDRRKTLRRVLGILADRRLAAPGHPLSREELFRAGWPGQRVDERSAANRLHVTIHALRELGLGDVLITRGDEYLLDPAVDLRRVTGEPEL